jgi:hypothetical protein
VSLPGWIAISSGMKVPTPTVREERSFIAASVSQRDRHQVP